MLPNSTLPRLVNEPDASCQSKSSIEPCSVPLKSFFRNIEVGVPVLLEECLSGVPV